MLYEFINTETQEVFEKSVRLSELDQYLADNPTIRRHYSAPPAIGDTVRMGLTKTPESFRHLLKNISKRAGMRSTVKYD